MIDRRSFLRAALFVAAAPVIVRASSLMPVKRFRFASDPIYTLTYQTDGIDWAPMRPYRIGDLVYVDYARHSALWRAIIAVPS